MNTCASALGGPPFRSRRADEAPASPRGNGVHREFGPVRPAVGATWWRMHERVRAGGDTFLYHLVPSRFEGQIEFRGKCLERGADDGDHLTILLARDDHRRRQHEIVTTATFDSTAIDNQGARIGEIEQALHPIAVAVNRLQRFPSSDDLAAQKKALTARTGDKGEALLQCLQFQSAHHPPRRRWR